MNTHTHNIYIIHEKPTQLPTSSPTPSPTPPPMTSSPTTSPTIRPPSYYIAHSSDFWRRGICLNELIIPKPYYIIETFNSIIDCCNSSFDKEKCFDNISEEDLSMLIDDDDGAEGGLNITTCTTVNVTNNIDDGATGGNKNSTTSMIITKCTTITNGTTQTTCTTTTTTTNNNVTDIDDGGGGTTNTNSNTTNITDCITTNITQPTYSPTLLPTLSPVLPDTIVDITMYGTLDIYNLPSLGYTDRQLKSLKQVFEETLTLVYSHSHLVHPTEIDVNLIMYGYTSLRNSRRVQVRERELGSLMEEVEHNSDDEMDNTNNKDEHAQRQEGRRAFTSSYEGTPQTLAYELKAPIRCDYKCQRLTIGHPGQRAFDELEKQYQQYIETGVLSSSLNTVGKKYDYYLPIFDTSKNNNEDAPLVSSGTLSYRLGAESDVTWVPTLTPTMHPSNSLIPKPSTSPTSSYEPSSKPSAVASDVPSSLPTTECSALKWHYIQGPTGTCTNSPNYPSLWDVDPTIGSYFLFSSLEECCYSKSPDMCIVSETCLDYDLLKPTSYCDLKELKYHPTTPSERTCTNSEEYPPAWDGMDGTFMFDDPVDCCTKYYPTGMCLIKSICY